MLLKELFRIGGSSSGGYKDALSEREFEPVYDKQWAKKYILDPLTAPEPSQETGLGTSHVNPYKKAAESKFKARSTSTSTPASQSASPTSPLSARQDNNIIAQEDKLGPQYQQRVNSPLRHHSFSTDSSREDDYPQSDSSLDQYPTPPSSASPTDCGFDFHPSNPFSTSFQSIKSSQRRPPSSSSCKASYHIQRQSIREEDESASVSFVHPSPTSSTKGSDSPPSHLQLQRNRSVSQHQHQYPARIQRTASPSPQRHRRCPRPLSESTAAAAPQATFPELPRNQLEKARTLIQNPKEPIVINLTLNTCRRYSSPLQRLPGDMSDRQLDMTKSDERPADRQHRRHHRKRLSDTDTIDALDTIGGTYHHGGPYDATLMSRNLNKKYSPVAAVEESNMEAIRATPRENIMDSLVKHVPLQGTASIPNGSPDMRGQIMHYKEGADLMREPDAEGGAYKRWDGVNYHPDDLKGKGEPSFTIERDLKKGKGHRKFLSEADAFEMRPGTNRFSKGTAGRQRSISQSGEATSTGAALTDNPDGDLRRSNTTGKRLSEGLKRRFGSLRRKKDLPAETVH